MKINRVQLDELILHITRAVLKEYSSMSSYGSSDSGSDSGTADDGVKPTDAQTSQEKRDAARDQKLADKKELDQAKMAKTTNAERANSYKSQYDQWRRYDKQNDEKAVTDLAHKVSSTSTMAENIRKMRS